jgi:hypothetical protein
LAGGGFQLFLQPLEQGERIGGRSGKTGDDVVPAGRQAAHLSGGALDHGLAKLT